MIWPSLFRRQRVNACLKTEPMAVVRKRLVRWEVKAVVNDLSTASAHVFLRRGVTMDAEPKLTMESAATDSHAVAVSEKCIFRVRNRGSGGRERVNMAHPPGDVSSRRKHESLDD